MFPGNINITHRQRVQLLLFFLFYFLTVWSREQTNTSFNSKTAVFKKKTTQNISTLF